MFKNISKNSGFTLIELMVSVVVFTLFIGMMISSYSNLAKALREANDNRKIYTEARDSLSLLTESIRLGTIDYGCYGLAYGQNGGPESYCNNDSDLTDGVSILALFTSGGKKRVFFRQEADRLEIYKLRDSNGSWVPDIGFSLDPNLPDWKPVLGEQVKVKELKFLLKPLRDPRDPNLGLNDIYQPTVTILLSLRREHKTYDVETTVVSRGY